ncbi:MAG TPA: cupin domain-containing protein [Candidatus Thermoplasmatota archaeon]|jgi:mannose-6-phosphate isomerase-like protein (cupin superfamily)|nr:cupin domain-containing protein [Candidatus Thermoplasmatota archaeon]
MAQRAAEGAYWGNLADAKGRFFAVLHTTLRTQTATMTVPPGEEAGPPEVHEGEDQVFLFLEGEAEVSVWERGPGGVPTRRGAKAGDIVVVPAGLQHGVRSVGPGPLFFFTVYGPPAY